MGGYGTLSICLHHPEKFISVASLSPANMTTDLLDWKLVIPAYEKLLGRKMAEQLGKSSAIDLLDTCDMIFSGDNPLLASIERDKDGKIIHLNEKSASNWQKYDFNRMIRENPGALKTVELLINCEGTDEFGLSGETEKIHQTLKELGIRHQFEIYTDPRAASSPHMIGIAYHTVPAIRFCQQHFT
nr:alpha/beta hydrolase-fold protein [Candidatus Njordarchaeota archaeon]